MRELLNDYNTALNISAKLKNEIADRYDDLRNMKDGRVGSAWANPTGTTKRKELDVLVNGLESELRDFQEQHARMVIIINDLYARLMDDYDAVFTER